MMIKTRPRLLAFLLPAALLVAPQAAALPQDGAAGRTGTAPIPAGNDIKVTYTGNEGFLVEIGGRKLLLDALYREGVKGYMAPSTALSEVIESGQPPFDGIDLALATHYHADHFHPVAVGNFLSKNPGATFISTEEARLALQKVYPGFAEIEDRVRGLQPTEGASEKLTVDGIQVEAFNLHHGRRRKITNLGFLISVGGRSILHMGDTESTTSDLEPLALPQRKIDVAFVPFWYLVEGSWREAIPLAVAPRKIVVMHLPAPDAGDAYIEKLGGWDKVTEGIRKAYPNATVFRGQLDSETF